MRVLIVPPKARPYAAEIESGLEPMQELVGGSIEMVDLDDKTSLVCNEEGKIQGLEGNRRIGRDIIAGTFFLCGFNEEGESVSLSDEQISKYYERFREPEHYSQEEVEDSAFMDVYIPDYEDEMEL
ncbi:DUF3846 domain-containing protein [Clostridium sp. 19966]|uniref:DUF3846 domain-containing protein n=1 Tax=Clostridium sp. 19966 TaxID=2768166 RepID=UPI0028DFEEC5|nr:DUF3846 domain-containing protein [Clostridium sp. 19966]MDT8716043.1 DUF3846 domain-containing protein [Clostridium sp. 19966]